MTLHEHRQNLGVKFLQVESDAKRSEAADLCRAAPPWPLLSKAPRNSMLSCGHGRFPPTHTAPPWMLLQSSEPEALLGARGAEVRVHLLKLFLGRGQPQDIVGIDQEAHPTRPSPCMTEMVSGERRPKVSSRMRFQSTRLSRDPCLHPMKTDTLPPGKHVNAGRSAFRHGWHVPQTAWADEQLNGNVVGSWRPGVEFDRQMSANAEASTQNSE